jgi:hypothetical protein
MNVIDHSGCVAAQPGQWWAHPHEGELGLWVFPDETESPYDRGSGT